jgi:hypothetical protein
MNLYTEFRRTVGDAGDVPHPDLELWRREDKVPLLKRPAAGGIRNDLSNLEDPGLARL